MVGCTYLTCDLGVATFIERKPVMSASQPPPSSVASSASSSSRPSTARLSARGRRLPPLIKTSAQRNLPKFFNFSDTYDFTDDSSSIGGDSGAEASEDVLRARLSAKAKALFKAEANRDEIGPIPTARTKTSSDVVLSPTASVTMSTASPAQALAQVLAAALVPAQVSEPSAPALAQAFEQEPSVSGQAKVTSPDLTRPLKESTALTAAQTPPSSTPPAYNSYGRPRRSLSQRRKSQVHIRQNQPPVLSEQEKENVESL